MTGKMRSFGLLWAWGLLCIVASQAAVGLIGLGAVDTASAATRNVGLVLAIALMMPGIIRSSLTPRDERAQGQLSKHIWVMLVAAFILACLRIRFEDFGEPHGLNGRIERGAIVAIAVVCLAEWLSEWLAPTLNVGPSDAGSIHARVEAAMNGRSLGTPPGVFLTTMAAGFVSASALAVIAIQAIAMTDAVVQIGKNTVSVTQFVWPALAAVCAWGAVGCALAASHRMAVWQYMRRNWRKERLAWRSLHAIRAPLIPIIIVAVVLCVMLPVWSAVRLSMARQALKLVEAGELPRRVSPFCAAAVLTRHGNADDLELLHRLLSRADKPPIPQSVTEPVTWPVYLDDNLTGTK